LAGPLADLKLDGFDKFWTRAEQQVSGWKTISLRLPSSTEALLMFSIDRGNGARPDLRAQLALDATTGEVVKWEPYSGQNLPQRIRSWVRWVHTGEAGGFIGQTVAGLASAGGAVLVWTGLALAWRRFFRRKPSLTVAPTTTPGSASTPQTRPV
jgi:uncharacterized iron-regulated membrane protein